VPRPGHLPAEELTHPCADLGMNYRHSISRKVSPSATPTGSAKMARAPSCFCCVAEISRPERIAFAWVMGRVRAAALTMEPISSLPETA
jgi:hypothetical protein